MKNVKANQLKTCIYLSIDEFDSIIKSLFDEDVVSYDYDLDGLVFNIYEDEDADGNSITIDTIYSSLANYFDVNQITSIHADDDEYLGVWLVYKA